jgi:hypothetical protein
VPRHQRGPSAVHKRPASARSAWRCSRVAGERSCNVTRRTRHGVRGCLEGADRLRSRQRRRTQENTGEHRRTQENTGYSLEQLLVKQ